MTVRTLVTLGAVSLGSALVSAPLWAQIGEQQPNPDKPFVEARGNVTPVRLPPGGSTPRMADGKPDFSGVWFSGPTGRANAWSVVPDQPRKEDPIPFKPEVRKKIDSMTRAERELGRAQVACRPLGVPGMWTDNPYPHQIVMKPTMFVHLIESNNNWRAVPLPKAHKPADEQEPLYMGDTATRWEGDTLVLETISFDTRPWIQGNGWFKTEQTKVIERLRRPTRNFLEYQYTVEDPNTLTRPWTSAWREFSLSVAELTLTENFCTNNENVEQFEKLAEQEREKQK
ncbi:MAG: hypothetical protein FJW14_10615 [Acidimicrobiia bacterium]|nr:hypothetical protein [Acidimicrobiia bacterium]